MKNFKALFLFLIIGYISTSCMTKTVEPAIDKTIAVDDSLINVAKTSQNLNLQKEATRGIYYQKHITNNGGATPTNAFEMLVSYKITSLADTNTVVESADSLAYNVYTSPILASTGGFVYALALMKTGEKATFYIPSRYAYGPSPSNTKIKANQPIILQLTLHSLLSEDDQIKAYIAKNKLTIDSTTTSGVKISRINAANTTANKLVTGDKIVIKYKGLLLDGTVFDPGNSTITYTIGTTGLIAGFMEGVSALKKGESARLIMPSALAYGSNGASTIPPYSPLVFEVSIESVNGL